MRGPPTSPRAPTSAMVRPMRETSGGARLRLALVVLAALGPLAACSKDAEPPPPVTGPSCGYHEDCDEGSVCASGVCTRTRPCRERSDCAGEAMCAGQRCICPPAEQRCLPTCETDDDCPSDGHCLEGRCARYPFAFDAPRPGGGTRGTLRVGLAERRLDFPMGVSMAGYGMRRGPQTPYRDSLGGSNAWLDAPDVRVAVFDDGAEQAILLRIPLCWSTDFLIADTARKVQARIGVNLVDNIVTSSPHSHSHPARFWHLVVDKYFGVFGYDEFSFEVFDRITDSFADAIVAAIEDLQPARLGYATIDDFDPEDRITRDRRVENDMLPGYVDKDHRMVIVRIDDPSGAPRAAMVHLGIHGTVFGGSNPILSGDAGGGIEVELDHGASAAYDRRVLGFFVQGNAGDVSPAGDDLDHQDMERVQLIGRRAWAKIGPAFDAIQTRDDVPVGIVSGRVKITRETIGYREGEFHDVTTMCEDTPAYFRYGAFQCVEGAPAGDRDPATRFSDGDLNCVFAVECLTGGEPVPQFQKTRLSAMRLGGLAFVTMPGEPVSQFGRNLSDRVEEALPSIDVAIVAGYSQDHHFYLLEEDDWLQGGYEASREIWGWKLAPHLADRAVELARLLEQPASARRWEAGNLKPMYWDVPAERRVRVSPNDEGDPAEVFVPVRATVERLEPVRFAWRGGHPGVDQPRITLERQTTGGWEPVRRPGGDVYDDRGFEMLVSYDGTCGRSRCIDHRWRVDWVDGRDFPVGTYRLSVTGRAWRDGAAVDYAVRSAAFELVPTRRLHLELRKGPGGVELLVSDPPPLDPVADADGHRGVIQSHHLRSEAGRADHGTPLPEGLTLSLRGSVAPTGTASVAVELQVQAPALARTPRTTPTRYLADGRVETGGARERPTTLLPFAPPGLPASGPARVRLELEDALGNRGQLDATIDL